MVELEVQLLFRVGGWSDNSKLNFSWSCSWSWSWAWQYKKIHISDVIAQFWYWLGRLYYKYLDPIIVLGYESILFRIYSSCSTLKDAGDNNSWQAYKLSYVKLNHWVKIYNSSGGWVGGKMEIKANLSWSWSLGLSHDS